MGVTYTVVPWNVWSSGYVLYIQHSVTSTWEIVLSSLLLSSFMSSLMASYRKDPFIRMAHYQASGRGRSGAVNEEKKQVHTFMHFTASLPMLFSSLW